MVAMTGAGVAGSNSAELASGRPCDLDHHALQAKAETKGRNPVLAGVPHRPDLSFDAADAEPSGDEHAVHPVQGGRRRFGCLALVARHPADRHVGVVGKATGAKRLDNGQVGVGQVDVLADESDVDRARRSVDAAEQVVPVGPIHVAERQAQPAYDVGIEPFAVQDLRNVVDRRRVRG
jgi:hypothetical protein